MKKQNKPNLIRVDPRNKSRLIEREINDLKVSRKSNFESTGSNNIKIESSENRIQATNIPKLEKDDQAMGDSP